MKNAQMARNTAWRTVIDAPSSMRMYHGSDAQRGLPDEIVANSSFIASAIESSLCALRETRGPKINYFSLLFLVFFILVYADHPRALRVGGVAFHLHQDGK